MWWFVYGVLFSTLKDALIVNAIFHKIFRHLKFTQPFCVSGHVFKLVQYICQFTLLDFYIISGGFSCLSMENLLLGLTPKNLVILSPVCWAASTGVLRYDVQV